jgi:hypothetical protein
VLVELKLFLMLCFFLIRKNFRAMSRNSGAPSSKNIIVQQQQKVMTRTTTKSAKGKVSQRKVSNLKDWRFFWGGGGVAAVPWEGDTHITITND